MEAARDFLIEVRCAVFELKLYTKGFEAVEAGKRTRSFREPVLEVLRAFDRQCSASYVRKHAWCRGMLCVESPHHLTNSYAHKFGSLLRATINSNPGLILIASSTVCFLALLPITVRTMFARNPYGGDSFEDYWISMTFVVTMFVSGFWPVFLACMWFRKFDFVLFKYEALSSLLACTSSEVGRGVRAYYLVVGENLDLL